MVGGQIGARRRIETKNSTGQSEVPVLYRGPSSGYKGAPVVGGHEVFGELQGTGFPKEEEAQGNFPEESAPAGKDVVPRFQLGTNEQLSEV